MQKHWIFIWRNMHACMITDNHWQSLTVTDNHWQSLTVTDSHCQKRRRSNCRFCPLTVIISTDSDCQWFWQILDSHWQSADSHCQWTTFLDMHAYILRLYAYACISISVGGSQLIGYACIQIHMHAYVHAYMHAYLCIYACIWIRMHAYACIYACICMHINSQKKTFTVSQKVTKFCSKKKMKKNIFMQKQFWKIFF